MRLCVFCFSWKWLQTTFHSVRFLFDVFEIHHQVRHTAATVACPGLLFIVCSCYWRAILCHAKCTIKCHIISPLLFLSYACFEYCTSVIFVKLLCAVLLFCVFFADAVVFFSDYFSPAHSSVLYSVYSPVYSSALSSAFRLDSSLG